jgi:hypothetical protein
LTLFCFHPLRLLRLLYILQPRTENKPRQQSFQ